MKCNYYKELENRQQGEWEDIQRIIARYTKEIIQRRLSKKISVVFLPQDELIDHDGDYLRARPLTFNEDHTIIFCKESFSLINCHCQHDFKKAWDTLIHEICHFIPLPKHAYNLHQHNKYFREIVRKFKRDERETRKKFMNECRAMLEGAGPSSPALQEVRSTRHP